MKRTRFYAIVTIGALALGYGSLFVMEYGQRLFQRPLEVETLNDALQRERDQRSVIGRNYDGAINACHDLRDVVQIYRAFLSSPDTSGRTNAVSDALVRQGKCIMIPRGVYQVLDIIETDLVLNARHNPVEERKTVNVGIAKISIRGKEKDGYFYRAVFLPHKEEV